MARPVAYDCGRVSWQFTTTPLPQSAFRPTPPPMHMHFQAAIYRQRGGAERMRIALRLSAMTRELAIAGIRSRNPEYSHDQVRRAYMRLMHGDDVAQRIWPDQPLIQP